MSRPQKIHPPIKASFNQILGAIAMGSGKGKAAAKKIAASKQTPPAKPTTKKKS